MKTSFLTLSMFCLLASSYLTNAQPMVGMDWYIPNSQNRDFYPIHKYLKNSFTVESHPVYPSGGTLQDGVDLYSGMNRVLIPLYTVTAKGLSIPISLGYASKGVKVSEIASNVGMGWKLNAGGCIRRMIRGLPDDQSVNLNSGSNTITGWIYDDVSGGIYVSPVISEEIRDFNPNDPSSQYCLRHFLGDEIRNLLCLNSVTNVTHDMQSDIYVIDCPFIGGSFLIANTPGENSLPTFKMIGASDLKIECILSDPYEYKMESFTITDGLGNKFHFTIKEKYKTYTVYEDGTQIQNPKAMLSETFSYAGILNQEYTTAWFLTSIETYLGDIVTFDYEEEKIYGDIFSGQLFSSRWSNIVRKFTEEEELTQNNHPYDELVTYRLKNITGTDFKVDILGVKTREDIYHALTAQNIPEEPCKEINAINIYSKFSSGTSDLQLVRRFEFEYKYMLSDTPPASNMYSPAQYFQGANKRLFLTGLIESSMEIAFPRYAFEYFGNWDCSNNGLALPHRYAYAADIYGFYNGIQTNTTLKPAVYVYPDMQPLNTRFWLVDVESSPIILSGANRDPSEENCKIGMLKKIIYPSGAEVSYDYELNQFNYLGYTLTGAGLRLISRLTLDGSSTLKNEIYSYEEGEALGMPQYGYYDPTTDLPPNPTDIYFENAYVRSNFNFSTSDGDVGYGKVSVTQDAQRGKTEYLFENTPTASVPTSQIPDASFYQPAQSNLSVTLIPPPSQPNYSYDLDLTFHAYPYHELVNVDWFRGRLKQTNIYKTGVFDPIKSISNEYNSIFYPDSVVAGLEVGFLDHNKGTTQDPFAATIKTVTYYNVSNQLHKVTTTSTDDNANSQLSNSEYTYTTKNQIRQVKSVGSDGTTKIIAYKYVSDFGIDLSDPAPVDEQGQAMYQLLTENRGNEVIEEAYLQQDGSQGQLYVTGGKIHRFKVVSGNVGSTTEDKVVPSSEYLLETGVPITLDPGVTGHFTWSEIDPNTSNFVFDSRYIPKHYSDDYDESFRLVSSHNPDDTYNTVIWDDYRDLIVATVMNAEAGECFYTGFEKNHLPQINNQGISEFALGTSQDPAFAGLYKLKFTQSNAASLEIPVANVFDPAQNGYKASMWLKGPVTWTLKVYNGTQIGLQKVANPPQNNTEWYYSELDLTKEDLTGITWDNIKIMLTGNVGCEADEMKFYPLDAIMNTTSYDNKTNVIASSTTNDQYSYIEYDDLSRVKVVRDHDRNILSLKEYNAGNPALFSWWDYNSNTPELQGVAEEEEELTITANLLNKVGVSYSFQIDSHDFVPQTSGQFTISIPSAGKHTLTMQVTYQGQVYLYSREITVF